MKKPKMEIFDIRIFNVRTPKRPSEFSVEALVLNFSFNYLYLLDFPTKSTKEMTNYIHNKRQYIQELRILFISV